MQQGGGWLQSFSGSCGRDWHWRWHWLRCQLRGWPHTQLTNSETLFVAFPLRLFASLQYTLLSHALPSPQHLPSPLGQGVDSCDKSLCRKHLNCISLWGNLQGWAGPKQRQMRMQILFWRHIENSVVAIRPPPLALLNSTLQPNTAPAFCGLALGSVLQTKRISGPYRGCNWNWNWVRASGIRPLGCSDRAYPSIPTCYLLSPSPDCTHKYIVLANILMTIGIFIEFMQKLQISFATHSCACCCCCCVEVSRWCTLH